MRFFEAAFAPCAATRRDVVRVAQLVYDDGQSVYEAFTPQAFKGWGQSEIPVLIDHNETKRAGTVTALHAHGDWWHASFMLDGPHADRAADLIERRGKVSPGFRPDEMDPDFAVPITPAHNATHWYTRARLNEISIASPGAIPWYQGAKVTRSYELKAPPTATPHRQGLVARETEPEGQVTHGYGHGQLLRRPDIGQVLRVGGVEVQ